MWDTKAKDVEEETSVDMVEGELVNIHKVSSSKGGKTFIYNHDYTDLKGVLPIRQTEEERREMIEMIVQSGIKYKINYH